MDKNDGVSYEVFVQQIQQSLFDAEATSQIKHINVERNKKLTDRNGLQRQFDLYWEFDIGGQIYRSIIECKDYASAVSIDKIDAIVGKMIDIPDVKAIYATKTGYQSGAETKARNHSIDLLIVREGRDEDWVDEDGIPLINKIDLEITTTTPPRITSFTPIVDETWLAANPNLDVDKINSIFSHTLNNEIIIKDISINEEYSLHSLAQKLLSKIPNLEPGEGSYTENFSEAYFSTLNGEAKLKISGYRLTYIHHEPVVIHSRMDYTDQLLGIVEKLHAGTKKLVFK